MLFGRYKNKVAGNHQYNFENQKLQTLGAIAFGLIVSGWLTLHIVQSDFDSANGDSPAVESTQSTLLDLPRDKRNEAALQMAERYLSPRDLKTYYTIFSLMKENHHAEAQELVKNLHDPLLMGYVQAGMLTAETLTPARTEFEYWLERNIALPQAKAVLARYKALYKDKPRSFALPQPVKTIHNFHDTTIPRDTIRAQDSGTWRTAQNAYIDRDFRTSFKIASRLAQNGKAENASAYWLAGLSAWRLHDYNSAAAHFALLSSLRERLSPQLAASGGFWAYRALEKSGNSREAWRHLRHAANYTNTFYGVIANARLYGKDWSSRFLPGQDVAITDSPLVREVVALQALGMTQWASERARARMPYLPADARDSMILAARQTGISLEALQQKQKAPHAAAINLLEYPFPEWVSRVEYKDPALILAITRKESGFNRFARSPRGAAGLMQIMPQTARQMVRRGALDVETADASGTTLPLKATLPHDLSNPDYNIIIGQSYLKHLQEDTVAGDNLFHLLAAYNAGPGTLIQWLKVYKTEDPLLFVESIPYRETRYYLQHVMKNYWIYSALMQQAPADLPLIAEGRWPTL